MLAWLGKFHKLLFHYANQEVSRDTYQQLEVILYEKQLGEIIDNREIHEI